MEDKMAAGAFGRAGNYGWDDPLNKHLPLYPHCDAACFTLTFWNIVATTLISWGFFYNNEPLSSFLIGSRPLPIRIQTHEADMNRHATQTLAHSLADLGLFRLQFWTFYDVICTDNETLYLLYLYLLLLLLLLLLLFKLSYPSESNERNDFPNSTISC